MRRESFVEPRRARWEELEELLREGPRSGEEMSRLAALYRSVAADLAAAEATEQPPDHIAYLDRLAGRAHNALYGTRSLRGFRPTELILARFPRTLRANAAFFWLAAALFYGPFVLGMAGAALDPALAARVLPVEQLEAVQAMYAAPTSRGGSGQDAQMAGFYVYNNIGIALRCFATGALGGLGSLFFLIYNGVVLGVMFGYVLPGPEGRNLLLFAIGHGAWELTGIVVSGAAGLRLGWALLVPGRRTRLGSVRAVRTELGELVAGAVTLLAVAALIEGFWSASPLPDAVKWAFGLLQIPLVAVWLARGGVR